MCHYFGTLNFAEKQMMLLDHTFCWQDARMCHMNMRGTMLKPHHESYNMVDNSGEVNIIAKYKFLIPVTVTSVIKNIWIIKVANMVSLTNPPCSLPS